jgi:hypothetical protein
MTNSPVIIARDNFEIHQRVRLVDEAPRWLKGYRPVGDPGRIGTVIGFSPRHPDMIRIRQDGKKAPALFLAKFWERLPPSLQQPGETSDPT